MRKYKKTNKFGIVWENLIFLYFFNDILNIFNIKLVFK